MAVKWLIALPIQRDPTLAWCASTKAEAVQAVQDYGNQFESRLSEPTQMCGKKLTREWRYVGTVHSPYGLTLWERR